MNTTNKALLNALALRRRRHALSILHERGSGVSEAELATLVAGAEAGVSAGDVPAADAQRVQIDLHHAHLPKLEASGLVQRKGDAVHLNDRAKLEREPIARFIERPDSVSETEEQILRSLADDRRQTVLSILQERDRSLSLEALSEGVAAAERAVLTDELTQETTNAVAISLHHSHLPMLAEAGVVDYDQKRQTVEYTGHPLLDDEANSRTLTTICKGLRSVSV